MTIRLFTAVFCAVVLLLAGEPRTSSAQEWREGDPLPHAMFGVAAVAADGAIYVAGGKDRRGVVSDGLLRYDVERSHWEDTLPSMEERRHFAAAAVLDGKIYVIGGLDEDDEALESVSVFDIATGAWSEADDLEEARWGHTTVVLDGRIYVLGGADDDDDILQSVEVYDADEDKWEISDRWELDQPRTAFATAAAGRAAYSFGGIGLVALPQVQRFDLSSGADVFIPPGLLEARAYLGAVAVGDTSIYIIGGRNARSAVDDVVVFLPSEPAGRQWQRAPRLRNARDSFAAVELDGTIYVIGGRDDKQNPRPMDSVEYLTLETRVGLEDPGDIAALKLEQNHPNPFTNSTAISFTVGGEAPEHVQLEVYDLQGRLVKLLVSAHLPPGTHEAEWDGEVGGRTVPSGVYMYVLRHGESTRTKLMTRIR